MKPLSSHQNFFCQDEPELCFSVKECHNCDLCCGPYHTLERPPSCLDFRSTEKFIFCNGYKTILNNNAVCCFKSFGIFYSVSYLFSL